ncbi:MAG TPA: MerR family transcriptional regulator, partial [Anaerolineales bacterium]|nr:MerR family transcriptional regulator [Anaerolineales bacterium]
MFTVKQLSTLAGVTPRTLHHYDEIGLLKPSRIGENGYRYYGEDALLKLQQILFYRELDIPLDEIKKILDVHAAAPAPCGPWRRGIIAKRLGGCNGTARAAFK